MAWKPYDWPDDVTPVGGFTSTAWVHHSRDLATWVTKGENCPACNALAGRTYPLAYWMATIMPGWHKNCNCRLSLAKVDVLESPHDLWGTEPYWWDPLQTFPQYFSSLFNRFLNYFSNLGKGDANSGFDNLNPLFKSKSWYTTAGWSVLPQSSWTLNPTDKNIPTNFPLGSLIYEWSKQITNSLNFSVFNNNHINLFGMTGISGNINAALNTLTPTLKVKMPWEAPTTTKTKKPWTYYTRN